MTNDRPDTEHREIETMQNEMIRYTDEAGWYAVVDGRCIQPEIDGTWDSAFVALAEIMDANHTPTEDLPGWEFLPF